MNTATPPTKSLTLAVSRGFQVDRAAGRLFGVSLITGDREAKGHGLYLDQKTIAGAGELVAAKGGRLKAGIRHASWADYVATGGDRILDLPGFFSGLTVKGNQLVGDMEFYDSFKAAHPEDFAHLLEVAEKTPELIGLSVEMYGYAVYVAEDGTEYSERPKDIPLQYDGLPAFRVTDLTAAAFVADPAANDGLFARFGRMFGGKHAQPAELRTLFSSFLAWARETNAFASAPTGAGNAFPSAPSDDHTASSDTDSTMQILASLKEKFGADKARHTRALELLTGDSTLTVEAIEAQLHAADFAALQSTVTTLTAEKAELSAKLATAEASLAAVTAERDQWQAKFERIKASGANPAGLDLGTPAAPGSGAGVNPWAKGSVNYTEQARLTRENPQLAAELKAAAKV